MPSESSRRIHILRESVARRIAAGEVIDRPLSVVRELLDNAIDARASSLTLTLENGGISSIRLVDDGVGMSREDLELCWLPHATSKIEDEEELAAIRTLGFRGEALASIAACARLRITSSTGPAESAHRLVVDAGRLVELSEAHGAPGSVVEVADLFYAMPGRRRFLKSPSAESALCRSTFLEKAMPYPRIAFRLVVDGELRQFLAAHDPAVAATGAEFGQRDLSALGAALFERVCDAHQGVAERSLMRVMSGAEAGAAAVAIAGSPSLYRKDRRYIQIYVNGRRITEFALVQAVEHGYSRYLPGGRYPVAFLFLSVDPALVDFNIHPAKREARFRNARELHHFVSELIKEALAGDRLSFEHPAPRAADTARGVDYRVGERRFDFGRPPARLTPELQARLAAIRDETAGTRASGAARGAAGPEELRGAHPRDERADEDAAPEEIDGGAQQPIRYLGQAFQLFLVAEVGERLFLVDQHAAHERILFDELVDLRRGAQRLLIPIELDVGPEESALLERQLPELAALGVEIERSENGRLRLTGVPQAAVSREAILVDFLQNRPGASSGLEQALFAALACRSAIKDGDAVDAATAVELIRAAFRLDNARCPHGRPIWFELSREELYRLVGRIV